MHVGSDKTTLGDWGKVVAYPFYLRFGNVAKRFGNKPGNGVVHLAGWIPIPKDADDLSSENQQAVRRAVLRVCLSTFASSFTEASKK